MKKKKIFGLNIKTDCKYCENASFENSVIICKKYKSIINGKCRAFRYDPIMRIPNNTSSTSKFTVDDFKL